MEQLTAYKQETPSQTIEPAKTVKTDIQTIDVKPIYDIKETTPEIIKKEEKPKAETIEISEEAKKRILPHVQPQESKYYHFKFNSQSNIDKLTKVLQSVPNHNITATYGVPKSSPDITLSENGQIIGKIHLLLCDRRDANKPEKYYVKLYFYHFKDTLLQNIIKNMLVSFFENFSPMPIQQVIRSERGGKRHNKSSKKHISHKRTQLQRTKKNLKKYRE